MAQLAYGKAMQVTPIAGVVHPIPNKQVRASITCGLYTFHGVDYTQERIIYTDGSTSEGYVPYADVVSPKEYRDDYHGLTWDDL